MPNCGVPEGVQVNNYLVLFVLVLNLLQLLLSTCPTLSGDLKVKKHFFLTQIKKCKKVTQVLFASTLTTFELLNRSICFLSPSCCSWTAAYLMNIMYLGSNRIIEKLIKLAD